MFKKNEKWCEHLTKVLRNNQHVSPIFRCRSGSTSTRPPDRSTWPNVEWLRKGLDFSRKIGEHLPETSRNHGLIMDSSWICSCSFPGIHLKIFLSPRNLKTGLTGSSCLAMCMSWRNLFHIQMHWTLRRHRCKVIWGASRAGFTIPHRAIPIFWPPNLGQLLGYTVNCVKTWPAFCIYPVKIDHVWAGGTEPPIDFHWTWPSGRATFDLARSKVLCGWQETDTASANGNWSHFLSITESDHTGCFSTIDIWYIDIWYIIWIYNISEYRQVNLQYDKLIYNMTNIQYESIWSKEV